MLLQIGGMCTELRAVHLKIHLNNFFSRVFRLQSVTVDPDLVTSLINKVLSTECLTEWGLTWNNLSLSLAG